MVRSEKCWWLWSFYMTFFFGSDGFAERVFFCLFGVILRAWRRQVCKGFKKPNQKYLKFQFSCFSVFTKVNWHQIIKRKN